MNPSSPLEPATPHRDPLLTALPPLALCTSVFVVLLHAAMGNFAEPGTLAFGVMNFMTGAFGRIAVPLFFLIAGFLFYRGVGTKGLDWKNKLSSRFTSLVLPYFCCATLYFLFSLLVSRGGMPGGFDASDGLWRRWLLAPAPFQLWFIRDLMVFAIAAPLWIRLPSLLRIPLLLVAAFFWLRLAEPLPRLGGYAVFSMEGVLWYFSGAWLAQRLGGDAGSLTKIQDCGRGVGLWVSGLLWLGLAGVSLWQRAQGVAMESLIAAFPYRLSSVFGLVFWFLLALRFGHHWRVKNRGFAFFLYLYHLPLCIYIRRFFQPFELGELPSYLLSVLLTIVLLAVAAEVLRRFLPRLYGLLTGGRV